MNKKDLIGKVVHYYDKIGVAVVKLDKNLKIGDKIKFVKNDKEFEETVESMQLEHEAIKEGKKKQEIAIKVNKETEKGTEVYSA